MIRFGSFSTGHPPLKGVGDFLLVFYLFSLGRLGEEGRGQRRHGWLLQRHDGMIPSPRGK
jgi:hypothetical protein